MRGLVAESSLARTTCATHEKNSGGMPISTWKPQPLPRFFPAREQADVDFDAPVHCTQSAHGAVGMQVVDDERAANRPGMSCRGESPRDDIHLVQSNSKIPDGQEIDHPVLDRGAPGSKPLAAPRTQQQIPDVGRATELDPYEGALLPDSKNHETGRQPNHASASSQLRRTRISTRG